MLDVSRYGDSRLAFTPKSVGILFPLWEETMRLAIDEYIINLFDGGDLDSKNFLLRIDGQLKVPWDTVRVKLSD